MPAEILKGQNVPINIWTSIRDVESEALTQLKNIATLPWVFHHIAVMPDVHYGKGATVGSVIAMRDAVSPSAVGVDIGCGMGAMKTNLKASDLPDSLATLRSALEAAIPVGFESHTMSAARGNSILSKVALPQDRMRIEKEKQNLFSQFKNLIAEVQDLESRALSQLGTLGGGNHFIELCLDTEGNVWLMLHSGSRNIGKSLAEVHIERAKKLTHNQTIVDRDLAVFLAGTKEMDEYRRDLYWAQQYAFLNRTYMLELYKGVMRKFFPQVTFGEAILCHHNYVSEEIHFEEKVFVTRKGAIQAGLGTLGIIPGSMGTKSYIVRGLGNPDSYNSASHGAGRLLSRGKAKKTISLEDFRKQTEGVECRKDAAVLDEAPGAYKDIDQVMANQSDLVEVVAQLKQVMCVKG